ncbi:MAG: hypothetical protein V4482_00325 [Pseudomonadota bacterium]
MNILTKLLASTFLTSAFMAPLAFGSKSRFMMIATDVPQVVRTRPFTSVQEMCAFGEGLMDMASRGDYKGVLAAAAAPNFSMCTFKLTLDDLERFYYLYTVAQISSHIGLADIGGISLNEKKNHHIAGLNLVSSYMIEWGSRTSIVPGVNDRIKEHSFDLSVFAENSSSHLVTDYLLSINRGSVKRNNRDPLPDILQMAIHYQEMMLEKNPGTELSIGMIPKLRFQLACRYANAYQITNETLKNLYLEKMKCIRDSLSRTDEYSSKIKNLIDSVCLMEQSKKQEGLNKFKEAELQRAAYELVEGCVDSFSLDDAGLYQCQGHVLASVKLEIYRSLEEKKSKQGKKSAKASGSSSSSQQGYSPAVDLILDIEGKLYQRAELEMSDLDDKEDALQSSRSSVDSIVEVPTLFDIYDQYYVLLEATNFNSAIAYYIVLLMIQNEFDMALERVQIFQYISEIRRDPNIAAVNALTAIVKKKYDDAKQRLSIKEEETRTIVRKMEKEEQDKKKTEARRLAEKVAQAERTKANRARAMEAAVNSAAIPDTVVVSSDASALSPSERNLRHAMAAEKRLAAKRVALDVAAAREEKKRTEEHEEEERKAESLREKQLSKSQSAAYVAQLNEKKKETTQKLTENQLRKQQAEQAERLAAEQEAMDKLAEAEGHAASVKLTSGQTQKSRSGIKNAKRREKEKREKAIAKNSDSDVSLSMHGSDLNAIAPAYAPIQSDLNAMAPAYAPIQSDLNAMAPVYKPAQGDRNAIRSLYSISDEMQYPGIIEMMMNSLFDDEDDL